jgi:uncharacterized FAD-dependent dehydrogenase
MNTKKIGIVVDDYKLLKFKESLEKLGFVEYTVRKFTATTSSISITIPEGNVMDIKNMCEELERYFKSIKN